MERIRQIITLSIVFMLCSCVKISHNSIPISQKELYGHYINNDTHEQLFILEDNTFNYINSDYDIVDFGIWKYREATKQHFINLDYNYLRCETKDSIYVAVIIDNVPDTIKIPRSHKFYVCYDHIFFGKIILTRGYQGDPDGAPALKWLEKSE